MNTAKSVLTSTSLYVTWVLNTLHCFLWFFFLFLFLFGISAARLHLNIDNACCKLRIFISLYDEYGKISVDQYQSLCDMGFEYLALLSNESGALSKDFQRRLLLVSGILTASFQDH